MRIGMALAMGIAIAAVDNFAFGGEASPVLILGLLLLATGVVGFACRKRGLLAAALLWACIPAAHLINHVLGLPDTIQPNTFVSILKLAAVTFGVAIVGTACGTAVGAWKQVKAGSNGHV